MAIKVDEAVVKFLSTAPETLRYVAGLLCVNTDLFFLEIADLFLPS